MNLPFKCEVSVPNHGEALSDVVSRWSDTYVEVPAIVVRPISEGDIVDAINYAKENDLKLVVANGGRAPFVPVTTKSLYLEMKNFDQVELDKRSETVCIGGGVSTGKVIKTLTVDGYYTLWPNSNAVGYVGCVLGGGSDTMNGLHGYMIDAVESIQLITANGVKLCVGPFSQGEERTLFNALCGAGFGLAIITSIVMKAFPIANLGLTNNSIWTRRIVLPTSSIEVAAKIFANMKHLPPALTITMVCTRNPPNAANPGAPMIMITAFYLGSSSEGEEAAVALYDPELVGSALGAETELVPFADVNLPLKPLSASGGHKGFTSAFLEVIDPETILAGFDLWIQLGEQYKDAHPTTLVFNRWDTKAIVENGQTEIGRSKFFEHRQYNMVANVMRWCNDEKTVRALEQFGDKFIKIMRRNTSGAPKAIANNQRPGMDLEELYSKEMLAELKAVKSRWDPLQLLWSPV